MRPMKLSDGAIYRVEGFADVIEPIEERIRLSLRSSGWSQNVAETVSVEIISYLVGRAYTDWEAQVPS